MRRILKQALALRGYRVLEAGSGQEALDVCTQYAGEIHLVLTDMVMPGGLSGLDVVAQLQPLRPKLKVILTSGYSLQDPPQFGQLPPGLPFLPKPHQLDDLLRLIRECLDKGGAD